MWEVVVIDDEPRIAEGIRRLVEWSNPLLHVNKVFIDSEEALHYIQKNWKNINLLVTDICMPKMDGLELIEHIRKFAPNLPCLITTGYESFEYAKKAISLNVVEYLLKPIDIEELKKIIDRFVFIKSTHTFEIICSECSNEVSLIKKEIEQNYAQFNIDAIADQLQLRKDYLSKRFKKEVGLNIGEYLTNIRLQNAQSLLSQIGQYKVYEVCQMVGYEDIAYFSRIFKQKYGITPKDYQRFARNTE